MKATVILDKTKYDEPIVKYVTNVHGISNVEMNPSNNELTFNFSTHNAMEGLREKLVKLGYSFELVY